MNRRKFMAGLTSIPIVLGMNSFSQGLTRESEMPEANAMPVLPNPTKQFDVYLHGLFVVKFNQSSNKIEIHIPRVDLRKHFHVYQAGSPKDAACTASSLCDLDKDGQYELKLVGFNGPTTFPSSFKDMLHVNPSNTPVPIATSERYCYLELPPTPLLKSVHRAQRNDKLPIFFGEVARKNNITSTTLPRIGRTYRLTYTSSTSFTPTLVKSTGAPSCWTYNGFALHLYAQPNHPIPPAEYDAALAAFDRLRAMAGNLELFATPFGFGTFTPVDPNNRCELGLGEQPNPSSGPGGGETANCVALFVGP